MKNKHLKIQKLILSISLFFGLFLLEIKKSYANLDNGTEVVSESVLVDPVNIDQRPNKNGYVLRSYKDRRDSWGSTFSVSLSNYTPINYEPDQQLGTYSEVYGDSSANAVYLNINKKKNIDLGSLAAELSLGIFSVDSNTDLTDSSTLSLKLLAIGAKVSLDSLFEEPLIVPYGSFGIYSVFFEEKLEETKYDGGTQAAFYWTAGAKLQLDWLDKKSSHIAYKENSVENTFIFIEARQYLSSSNEADPDFGTDVNINSGIELEF